MGGHAAVCRGPVHHHALGGGIQLAKHHRGIHGNRVVRVSPSSLHRLAGVKSEEPGPGSGGLSPLLLSGNGLVNGKQLMAPVPVKIRENQLAVYAQGMFINISAAIIEIGIHCGGAACGSGSTAPANKDCLSPAGQSAEAHPVHLGGNIAVRGGSHPLLPGLHQKQHLHAPVLHQVEADGIFHPISRKVPHNNGRAVVTAAGIDKGHVSLGALHQPVNGLLVRHLQKMK